MNQLIDSRGPIQTLSRRGALGLLGAAAALLGTGALPRDAVAEEDIFGEGLMLRDPDIPVVGNSSGDITIVEWFDFQCPYCRKIEPEVRQVVQDDGKVRLVWKDWPILGPASVTAARMAVASRYQDKFEVAHDALISVNSKLTDGRIREALAGAGLDMDRLDRDLAGNASAIDATLARNNDQATGLQFRGTPAFIVGKFRVPGILSMKQFAQAIADARKAAAAKKT